MRRNRGSRTLSDGVRLGIKTKWVLFNLAAVGLAIVPASGITVLRVYSEMEGSAHTAAEGVIAQLAGFSGELIAVDENLAIQRNIENVKLDPDVRYALVIEHAGGRVVGIHPDHPLFNAELPEELRRDGEALAAKLGIAESGLVHLQRPITVAGVEKPVGSVSLGYSLARRRAEIRRFLRLLVGLNVLGLAGGAALGVVFANRFSRPVIELTSLAQSVAKGNFDVTARVSSRDEVGILAEAFNSMAAFLKRGQFMRHALEKYVSTELAERIDRGQILSFEQIGKGERREVTVLFLDIRDFTGRSEKMGAEDIVRFLNTVFNKVSDPVLRAEGAIDKFIGDAMLSVFGFPIAHEDDAFRAVVAAVRIQEVRREYNRERVGWGLDPVGIGIGLNTGTVVAGNMGCSRKLEFTVIGDAVNVAARLVGLAKPGQILVSGST